VKAGSSVLKFSIKACWVPLYINGKLIGSRVSALHLIDEETYARIDDRGKTALHDLYYSEYGCLCGPEEARLASVEFLEKNRAVYHALLISYDTTIMVLGYYVFHYRCTETNPQTGIHIDYFTSLPVNYPGDIRLPYLGNYPETENFYSVRGVGRVTIAMACSFALELHPETKGSAVAVDLTARPDKDLIAKRYVKGYGFKFYKGPRGKGNDMYLSRSQAASFLKKFESDYKRPARPEGNGLTYINPVRN
jgi:hypothetical protein